MKKLNFYTMTLAVAALALTACEEEDNPVNNEDSRVAYMLPSTQSVQLTDVQKDYVKQNNTFAFNFYRALNNAESSTESNICSPLSLSYVLGMLNSGAQGQTRQEITELLGFGDAGTDAVNEFFGVLMQEAPQVDAAVTLRLANMIDYRPDVEIEDKFSNDMVNYYQANVTPLDFLQPKVAADYINNWCDEKTDGMIKKLVDEEDISPTTLMALLNAIYFRATWASKFDKADTSDETFHAAKGDQTVAMMHRKANIQYAHNDTYSLINLPYGSGDKWSMKVLLPNEGKSVTDVINSLSVTTWTEACRQLRSNKIVDVKLPRFSTRSSLILNKLIAQMGAPTMFKTGVADFDLMTKNWKLSEGRGLQVSLLKQVAATEVTEEGTQLAAATVAMLTDGESFGDEFDLENVNFHADHPFVYIVQEASSGAIFFIGTYRGAQ